MLKEGGFRLDIRKKVFHSEGAEALEQVAQRSFMEVVKGRLDKAWSNLML